MAKKKAAKKKGALSKRIWKFQESAVAMALAEHITPSTVHWNSDKSSTPDGMSIDPDVVIGTDTDQPEALVFVTHASAERAGEKKFWRTVAEVVEAKRLGSEPRVLSVLFSGNVKPELKVAYSHLFDGVLHLGGTDGEEFSHFITDLAIEHGGKPAEACGKILVKLIGEGGVPHWRWFVGQIKTLSKSTTGATHDLITSGVFQSACRKPETARMTSLRRSVCKLITLPPEVRDPLLEGNVPATAPLHTLYLGWLTEGVDGEIEYTYGDSGTEENELEAFLDTCRDPDAGCTIEDVRYLISRAEKDLPNFVGYARKLREIGDRNHCFRWIINNWDDLITETGMDRWLQNIFDDPETPLGGSAEPSDHWLFDSMMVLLRTETGKSDGYGYSKLGEETGFTKEISALAGTTIAPYLQRRKELEPRLRKGVARVFAGHLNRIGKDEASDLVNSTIAVACSSVFRFQMMNYRLFNPIDWLVERALHEVGLSVEANSRHDSFLSGKVSGAATSTRNLFRVGNGKTWIKCQSGYDGKIDKRKELCGRIGAMKLCYNAAELAKHQFILVVDGFFDREDIDLFVRSGWDGVYYYDEVADLADTVTSFISEKVIEFPDEDESLPMAAEDN